MVESGPRSYEKFVGVLANVLDDLRIEYGFAGSFASSQYGEPRQTLDADLTVHLQPGDADRFAVAFRSVDMFADVETIRETFGYRNPIPFGVIDPHGGWKADCYLLRSTAYDRAAFARRRELPYPEAARGKVWLYAPEDVILMKLDYYRISQGVSTKHLRDIAGMLANMGRWEQPLDMAYLNRWARELRLIEYWAQVWDEFQRTSKS
ncbi:MAG TPA: hypothetical protein VIK33_02885 [Anaerolineae bacterium]